MKYPRTFHSPNSPGGTSDDKRMTKTDYDLFFWSPEIDIVITEKLDGENTCFSRDFIHARSEDSGYNAPWQTMMRNRWEGLRHTLPENLVFYAENMYAVHSVEYEKLGDLFFVFGIVLKVQDKAWFLSWHATEEICAVFGFSTVPVIGSGKTVIPDKSRFGGQCEGIVMRNGGMFDFDDFSENVVKVVRADHVQTDEHWTKHWKKANIS